MSSINNVLVMNNRETPLEFVGRKKVPKSISKGTGFKGVPTEQQKYYIYKNYVEPALLLKNQQQDSEIVKAIKEALGVKTVVSTTSIVDSFGFTDEGAQQKVKKEKDNITKKLVNDAKIVTEQQKQKNDATKLLQASIKRQKPREKLSKVGYLYNIDGSKVPLDGGGKANTLNPADMRFRGAPTTNERFLKANYLTFDDIFS